MGLTIRKARAEDAQNYAACHILCWQAAYKGIIPDSYLDNMWEELGTLTARNKQNLGSPGSFMYYCIEEDEALIGRLVLCKSRDEDKPAAGEVAAVYLRKEHWDKGYGRQMMRFAIETLKQKEYKEIFLWVLEENSRARRFYEKCGYEPDGKRKLIDIGKPLIEMRYIYKGQL